MIQKRSLIFILMGALFVSCSNLPRDPKETLRHVQESHRLRVGLVEHPPWVVRTTGEPAGAEVELVRQLASELGATPEWHWGGEQPQLEALEHYELDLVVGGLTSETPWSKQVGLTSPYFEEFIKVGMPNAMQKPQSLKGVQVAALRGERTGAYLEHKDAQVVRVDDLKQAQGAVAAPSWQLEQMGLSDAGFELSKEKHVMAAPPGENGFIKRLDEFLSQHRSDVKGLLQQEVTRR